MGCTWSGDSSRRGAERNGVRVRRNNSSGRLSRKSVSSRHSRTFCIATTGTAADGLSGA